MNQFRTHQLALELCRDIEAVLEDKQVKGAKRDQLDRASLSVVLNLHEGSSRPSLKERKRFYFIALGSFREVQSIIALCNLNHLDEKVDKLGAHLYKLCHS